MISAMPSLSHDAIKTAFIDGKVFAISIDTAVFDRKQKNFRNAILRQLDQFHRHDIRIIIADVIVEEMKKHLHREASDTQRILEKALQNHNRRWRRESSDEEYKTLLIDCDVTNFVNTEINTFLQHVNAEVIKVSDMVNAVEKTFDRYFNEKPPFGSAERRKYEFPDAFTLLRLEEIAAEHEGLMICVTPDKGWKDFAEQSDNLICVDKLEDTLALFNAADQDLTDLANSIVEQWRESEGGAFIGEVITAFDYRLEVLDFDIRADADINFEAEALSAVLQYILPDSIGIPTVISTDVETVTFLVCVDALVGFEALFTFFARDSIDKDTIDLGSTEKYIETTLPFELIITASRAMDDDPIFHDVEVARKFFEVDFGFIDAFPNQDPYHEKY